MSDSLPILLVPGLLSSPRLYLEQLPDLWRFGPTTLADPTRHDTMGAIARHVLETAPPRFALIGLSMGGYVAFEILRQAPERVVKLALLDTSARPDTPEKIEQRQERLELARTRGLAAAVDEAFAQSVHRDHAGDARLREIVQRMAAEVGLAAFARQQAANIGRPDSRPMLGSIHCPVLVLVGDDDQLTPPDCAAEIASGIPGARLVTVPDSGHLSTLEQPDAVTRALVELLES